VLVSFNTRSAKLGVVALVVLFSWPDSARAQQQSTVTIRAVIQGQSAAKQGKTGVDASDVVVWLKAVDQTATTTAADAFTHKKWQLVQHNKMFQPHVLIVPVGAVVEFPNRDPFFHNVFSLYDGKRFDLGLYEAGATNSVRFDRLGVSFLFCNIHSDMSAVVVAVDTHYFGISGRNGYISIANVPVGKYELNVWYERSLHEDLKSLTRVVTISSPTTDLGAINVPENPSFSPSHKNKYGQDYTSPPTPSYSHP
jgi:plastocyanin